MGCAAGVAGGGGGVRCLMARMKCGWRSGRWGGGGGGGGWGGGGEAGECRGI